MKLVFNIEYRDSLNGILIDLLCWNLGIMGNVYFNFGRIREIYCMFLKIKLFFLFWFVIGVFCVMI